jgi:hypothetical protein
MRQTKYILYGNMVFSDRQEVIDFLRDRGDESYNDASDEYIFNEAYEIGELEIKS